MVDLIVALFGLAILFILFAFLLALYVFKSIGFMDMANNRGMENAWLAWVPVADLYIGGKLVEEIDFLGMRITNMGLWLPLLNVLSLFFVSSIILVLELIYWGIFVFFLFYLYRLYCIYAPSKATLYTVFSIIGLWPIFVFMIRNNKPLINEQLTMPPKENENLEGIDGKTQNRSIDIEQYKCKNCGAAIKTAPNIEGVIICEYCGSPHEGNKSIS